MCKSLGAEPQVTDVNRGRNTKSKELMQRHLICYNSRKRKEKKKVDS